MGSCTTTNVVTGCFNGTPVLIHVTDDGLGAPATRIIDVAGNIVAGADATNTTPGVCPAVPVLREVLVYMERNGGTVTVADIVANTGAIAIHSITVKQISGRGSVAADSGSGVPLDAGETWSWSAVSPDNTDTLNASVLTLDAGGGEQRITATYTR
jgi:hypothetical protein